MARFTKAEQTAITAASNDPQGTPGDWFICMGPHCWGRAQTPGEAIANAKKNRVKIYEGKGGWRFMLFAVRDDVRVDDMGAFCWTWRDGEDHHSPNPYREIYRSPAVPAKTRGDLD